MCKIVKVAEKVSLCSTYLEHRFDRCLGTRLAVLYNKTFIPRPFPLSPVLNHEGVLPHRIVLYRLCPGCGCCTRPSSRMSSRMFDSRAVILIMLMRLQGAAVEERQFQGGHPWKEREVKRQFQGSHPWKERDVEEREVSLSNICQCHTADSSSPSSLSCRAARGSPGLRKRGSFPARTGRFIAFSMFLPAPL